MTSLINNAGYELAGALEELSSEEARAQFETNFFGVVRMVNAVLPHMRQQRRGHIINVSSLTGLTAIPFLGIYSASKFALEGYTEALRQEVKPFNIQVSLTEAGFLRTPMMNHRQVGARRMTEYDPWRQRALQCHSCFGREGARPGGGGRTLLENHFQQTPATALPDWATSEVRRPLASVSSRRDVRTRRAAELLTGQESMSVKQERGARHGQEQREREPEYPNKGVFR